MTDRDSAVVPPPEDDSCLDPVLAKQQKSVLLHTSTTDGPTYEHFMVAIGVVGGVGVLRCAFIVSGWFGGGV